MKRFLRPCAVLLLVAVATIGCGNKGDLVLPPPPADDASGR